MDDTMHLKTPAELAALISGSLDNSDEARLALQTLVAQVETLQSPEILMKAFESTEVQGVFDKLYREAQLAEREVILNFLRHRAAQEEVSLFAEKNIGRSVVFATAVKVTRDIIRFVEGLSQDPQNTPKS